MYVFVSQMYYNDVISIWILSNYDSNRSNQVTPIILLRKYILVSTRKVFIKWNCRLIMIILNVNVIRSKWSMYSISIGLLVSWGFSILPKAIRILSKYRSFIRETWRFVFWSEVLKCNFKSSAGEQIIYPVCFHSGRGLSFWRDVCRYI